MSNQIVDGDNANYVYYWLNQANESGAINFIGQNETHVFTNLTYTTTASITLFTIAFPQGQSAYITWKAAQISSGGNAANGYIGYACANISGTPGITELGTGVGAATSTYFNAIPGNSLTITGSPNVLTFAVVGSNPVQTVISSFEINIFYAVA